MSAVRTVLAVALSTALLGATLPVVEEARADRTAARIEAEIDSVERAARQLLAREDPVVSGQPAGRTVTVFLPTGSFTEAPVRHLSFGGPADGRRSFDETGSRSSATTLTPTSATTTPTTTVDAAAGTTTTSTPTHVVYRVGSRPPRHVELDPRLRISDPLVLGPGHHRLRLSLVRTVEGVQIRIRTLSEAG